MEADIFCYIMMIYNNYTTVVSSISNKKKKNYLTDIV